MVKNPVEYRQDWDKKPFPKSDKSIIAENVDEEFFTGAGANIEPPEIGQDSTKPIGIPDDRIPPKNTQDNQDETYFTGVGENIEPPEIGASEIPAKSNQQTEN